MAVVCKAQVPYLVDPNTDTSIQDSQEAIAYLFKQYGGGSTAVAA